MVEFLWHVFNLLIFQMWIPVDGGVWSPADPAFDVPFDVMYLIHGQK